MEDGWQGRFPRRDKRFFYVAQKAVKAGMTQHQRHIEAGLMGIGDLFLNILFFGIIVLAPGSILLIQQYHPVFVISGKVFIGSLPVEQHGDLLLFGKLHHFILRIDAGRADRLIVMKE